MVNVLCLRSVVQHSTSCTIPKNLRPQRKCKRRFLPQSTVYVSFHRDDRAFSHCVHSFGQSSHPQITLYKSQQTLGNSWELVVRQRCDQQHGDDTCFVSHASGTCFYLSSFDLSANYLLKFLWLNRFEALPMVTKNSEGKTTVVNRLWIVHEESLRRRRLAWRIS